MTETKIKFGTDGWRAVIAKDFTVDNVARIALATAEWLVGRNKKPSAVVGFDSRFGGKLFSLTVAKVLALKGVKVYYCPNFVSTPAVSLGIVKLKADLGVMITASHNPPDYNGYKLKGNHGGPLMEEFTKEIESMVDPDHGLMLDDLSFDNKVKSGEIVITNLEDLYVEHVHQNFDLEALRKSGFRFAFDAMYGAGQNIMKRIFPDIDLLHCEENPTFKGIAPEPLQKNLVEFSDFIRNSGKIDCGLAVDGDADRIALFDKDGNYIDSHTIILLLIHYLAGYKKLNGKVVTGFSSTVKVEVLGSHYGLAVQRVRIGFKDICRVMLNEDVLVGGEESGGITAKGHIPERDGIWMGLLLWRFMAETGKNIHELIQEVFAITGSFAYERFDMPVDDGTKSRIVAKCKNEGFTEFGKNKVVRIETLDGFKYFLSEDEWIMIRPSGTEPLLRIYAESKSMDRVKELLELGKASAQSV
jgi:phosphomannomutase